MTKSASQGDFLAEMAASSAQRVSAAGVPLLVTEKLPDGVVGEPGDRSKNVDVVETSVMKGLALTTSVTVTSTGCATGPDGVIWIVPV